MNFSQFPTRACEWVAWALFFVLFFCLFVSFVFVSLDRDGVWLSYRTGKVGGVYLGVSWP